MKRCPVCKSIDIGLFIAGIDGRYQCKNCNYIGSLILEEYKKEKSSFGKRPRRKTAFLGKILKNR